MPLGRLVCGLALFLFGAVVPARANAVANPGFELGGPVDQGSPILDWPGHSAAGEFGWGVGNADVHSGSAAAVTGCMGAACLDPVNGTLISQSLTTIASDTYALTFWYDPRVQGSGSSSGTNFTELDVCWNGSLVLSLPNKAPGYTQYTVNGLVATGGSTVIQFNGRNDPMLSWLDDVDVELAQSGTPEPSSVMLGILGVTAIVALRRRRQAPGADAQL